MTELLIVLAVVAGVAGYALPGFQTTIANQRQTSAVNRIVTSVLLARSLAITQGYEVIVCPTLDGVSCDDHDDWNHGWMVLQVTDADAGPAGVRVVRLESGFEHIVLDVNRTLFRFRPRGLRATNGTFIVCAPRASQPKAVIVSYNGRPRTSGKLASGEPIECETS